MRTPTAVTLPDGQRLPLSRLRGTDAHLAFELVDQCSAEDLRLRFGATVRDSGAATAWLLPRGEADLAVAVRAPGESRSPIAIINLNVVDRATRELAALVSPPWRRRGVAGCVLSALLPHITGTVVGVMGWSNHPARRLVARVCPNAAYSSHDVIEFAFATTGPPGRACP